MTTFNSMQAVKRQFFSLRNGVIADMIRNVSGGKYKIIFGLNLPQLTEIATSLGCNVELGDALWANKSTRESLMLAPMLMNPDNFSFEKSKQWVAEVPTHEVADILCHKLLRHTTYAHELAKELADSPDSMTRYTAIRLLFNLLPASVQTAEEVCRREIELQNSETLSIATQLLDELEFFH